MEQILSSTKSYGGKGQTAQIATDNEASLPLPWTLPDAEVVIYDGNCVFCKKQVDKLFRWDGRGRLAFVSLHDPFVQRRYPDLTHEQLMQQMYLITRDHQRLAGARALRHVSARLPKLWMIWPLMNIPFSLPVWQFFYMQITKQRYRIAGRTGEECEGDSCQLRAENKGKKA